MSLSLVPNLGSEEAAGARSEAEPAIAQGARLWRLLFAQTAELVGVHAGGWPEGLCAPANDAVFDWIATEGVVPWYGGSVSEAPGSLGPDSQVVTSVHDKAFAHEVARQERRLPAVLERAIAIFEPSELAEPDAVLDRIEAELKAWPSAAGDRFTLKPRLGSSGRGRVAGRRGEPYEESVRGALPRFAQRGGCILEPWLERQADLSVALHVPESPADGIVLLGSLRQLVARSGVYRGHYGQVDSRGRIFSGSPWDETIREAAVEAALEARTRGYWGPCGTDAFSFTLPAAEGSGPEALLRPIVEFNARFTMGIVAIGLVRRALPRFKAELAFEPGMRGEFVFALSPPFGADHWADIASRLPSSCLVIPLDGDSTSGGAALIACRELSVLGDLADQVEKRSPNRDER